MKKIKEERWFYRLIHKPNPWVVKIVGGTLTTGLLAFIVLIWSLISQISFVEILKKIWQFILNIFTFKIPVWIILIGLIIIIIVFRYIVIFKEVSLYNAIKKKSSNPFLDYTKDEIKNWLVTWEYSFDEYEEKYRIIKIILLCLHCECTLKQESHYDLKCVNCNTTYRVQNDINETIKELEILIHHKIKTGAYKNSKYYKSLNRDI